MFSHAEDFRRESGNNEAADSLIYDYRKAKLTPEDRALCDFAAKTTIKPAAITPADLDGLRAHGFDDEAITIAVQVISYFNYINRIADALGVDPEPEMTISHEEWNAKRAKDYTVS